MRVKQTGWTIAAALAVVLATSGLGRAQSPAPRVEYIDIRWDGLDRMCIVYADGHVEFLNDQLKSLPRPDDANKRAYYMTVALNRMIAKGYEFVAFISDEIIMKRALP
jgi:hypothetical protein